MSKQKKQKKGKKGKKGGGATPAANAILGYIKPIFIFASGCVAVSGLAWFLYNDYNEYNEKQYGPGAQYHLYKMLEDIAANAPAANDIVGFLKSIPIFASGCVTVSVAGAQFIRLLIIDYMEGKQKQRGSGTQNEFDNMLKKIVMAKYTPEVVPTEYIDRAQDEALRERLQNYITDQGKFFMLMGESGSGKTTMMQNLLKNEYGEGVIFVKVNSTKLLNKDPGEQGEVLEEAVRRKFIGCAKHPRGLDYDFLDFIGHANQVRLEAVKKVKKAGRKGKDHPLILYITLDSKDDKLPYETMAGIAKSFGVLAGDLSDQDCCRTILEFSKTAISDKVGDIRPRCEHFQVDAMTEGEFSKIGKQVLGVKEDPHNVASEYLEYYHNWLGGHTKALSVSQGKGVKSQSMHSCLCYLCYNCYSPHISSQLSLLPMLRRMRS